MDWFNKYRKFWVALLGAVINVVVQQFPDQQWVQIAVAVLTAIGVYQVPNDLGASSRKR